MNYHLAILKKPYIDAILDGKKSIESRFYRKKHPAIAQLRTGDKIFLKQSSGPVIATARAAKVHKYLDLNPASLDKIKLKYNSQILGDKNYWQSKRKCRFGLLIQLTNVTVIKPVKINKKDWRAWVVLTKEKDFGLLSS